MRQGTWSSDLTYGRLSDIKLDRHHGQGVQNEPRCEKTGLRGFRPGPTQTGLYNHR